MVLGSQPKVMGHTIIFTNFGTKEKGTGLYNMLPGTIIYLYSLKGPMTLKSTEIAYI